MPDANYLPVLTTPGTSGVSMRDDFATAALQGLLANGPSGGGPGDFLPIGEAGSRVELLMRFETQSSLAGLVLGPVFEGICNQLVDSFARRARQIYG